MIIILALAGLLLCWGMKYADARTKFTTEYNGTRWLQDSALPIAIAVVAACVSLFFVNKVPHDMQFTILSVPMQANYVLAFLAGYSGTGLIARTSSIVTNIINQ
jgi:hypothetical protein